MGSKACVTTFPPKRRHSLCFELPRAYKSNRSIYTRRQDTTKSMCVKSSQPADKTSVTLFNSQMFENNKECCKCTVPEVLSIFGDPVSLESSSMHVIEFPKFEPRRQHSKRHFLFMSTAQPFFFSFVFFSSFVRSHTSVQMPDKAKYRPVPHH